MVLLLAVWAAETDITSILFNYGVLGIFFVLAITKQIYFKATVDILNEQITAQREIIKEFQRATKTQTLPALGRATEVLEAQAQILPAQEISLHDFKHLVERLEELTGEKKGRQGE